MSKQAILCVDDERIVLLSLRDQITKYFGDRYRYEFAESVDEAWEVINELRDDQIDILIVLSDWLMPSIRGDEFLAQVHQKFPKIVTVLLSGQADQAAVENARQTANLYAYVAKPWEEDRLISVIRSGLEQVNE
jgi:DNA-binding NtrC family response regulator